jgi:eukaryotic-like serine/threonine-protein kinase
MATTRVLNDRYEMDQTLGEGGMARVYRGTDRVLGRTVAIKVLSGKYAGDESFVTRFRREAQAAAGLNHPHVVSVFDTGDDGDRHYIVMEYVEGETLKDILRSEGRLPSQRAVAIGADVATALETAHEKGLVHRDVKPGNVMLDREGRVKVMDFGIARAAADDTLTQTGLVLGTASYLSPEQAQGLPVDARSDVYSLGCVLYEMLTGRPPFEADSPVSIAYQHVNEEPRPPSELEPSVPPALDAAVVRALAKDPADRFPTAGAFRSAIEASAAEGGAATEPMAAAGDTAIMPAAEAPPEEGPARGRRSWLPMALVGAAILALAGALALALIDSPDRRAGRRDRQEQSPPPAEEPTTPAALSVEQAIGLVDQVLTEAVNTDQMTFEAAGKIGEKVDAAYERWQEGDPEKALDELSHAHDEVDKAVEEGQIVSEETASAAHDAISAVESAIGASAPAVGGDEGNGGDEGDGGEEGFVPPGQSKKDKGKGKGND